MPEPPTPDPPPQPAYRAYYGTGYAGADFRGIGGDLLKTFPPLAPPVPALPAIDPTAAGFGVHGPHLLAPLIDTPGGSRVSPCPVCRTAAAVSRSAGGWVPLRCESCGTEFVATDGTPPPPPPPPASPPPLLPPKADPLPSSLLSGTTTKARLYVPSPSFFSTPSDGRWYTCPWCRKMDVLVHDEDTDHTPLDCPECRSVFTVGMVRRPPSPPARVLPPRTLVRRVLRWLFRG